MKSKFLKTATGALLAMTLLATSASAATIGGATVRTTDTGLNLRASATTASGCLGVIPNGGFLLVEEKLDGWYKVVYNGVEGYVSADYAAFSETLDGTFSYAAATDGTDVNLRAAAGTGSGIVKCLPLAGTGLTVTGVSGSWLKVLDAAGAAGYIRSDLVSYASDTAALPSAGSALVETAKQYLGYRYVWGGMSPSTGFDCSGFVNYVYGLYGYSMERVAQNIYSTNGTAVARDYLQPGDLLFFGGSAWSIGHVGMYIGNNQFIHAAGAAYGVIISDLDGYYARSYVGAKRILA